MTSGDQDLRAEYVWALEHIVGKLDALAVTMRTAGYTLEAEIVSNLSDIVLNAGVIIGQDRATA